MTKFAIFQNGDEPQIVSTAAMLKHAGYELRTCGPKLRNELSRIGCDTVLSTGHMEVLGYDRVPIEIIEATDKDMDNCDLFIEIKVRNLEKIWNRWPRLRNRTIWWRVNGAQPEICPKGGDEVHLTCPLVTACLWYGVPKYRQATLQDSSTASQGQSSQEHEASREVTPEQLLEWSSQAKPGDHGMAYTFWPPYPRSREYDVIDRSGLTSYKDPYCLCHSARAWGYGPIVDHCVEYFRVQVYGNNSPAGQISHREVANVTKDALALVHLKSVDCPGWALYEAMLSGCPVLVGRQLNSRMLAYDLLKDGETCYEFGVPASLEYGRGDTNYQKCIDDIGAALTRLKNPVVNRDIGERGRQKLNELMWRETRDGDSFNRFMERHFGK